MTTIHRNNAVASSSRSQGFGVKHFIVGLLGIQGAAWGRGLRADTFGPVARLAPAPGQPWAPSPAPLAAPVQTGSPWQWRNVAGSMCANGKETGYAVNLQAPSRDLLVFLKGGGACKSFFTCRVVDTAKYIKEGYTEATFQSDDLAHLSTFALTNRNYSDNPLRSYNYAFFPYCTGDLHAGNNTVNYRVAQHDTHHVGSVNIQKFLGNLNQTVSGIQRVLVAGSSAGGFGAVLNYEKFVAAFPGAQVDVLDDSGIAFDDTPVPDSWKLDYPSFCVDKCNNDFSQAFLDTARHFPESRFSLTAYSRDDVLPRFLDIDKDDFDDRLKAFASMANNVSNVRYFFKNEKAHENLDDYGQASNGISLISFVQGFVSNTSDWRNVPF